MKRAAASLAGAAALLVVLGLSATSGAAARVGEPAPEIAGGAWLNGGPHTMAGLRGRVVFLEFWTHG